MNALEELLSDLKDVCAGLVDKRQGQTCRYTMADIGLAAFSVFFMQSPSFLAHQRTLAAGHGRSNVSGVCSPRIQSRLRADNLVRTRECHGRREWDRFQGRLRPIGAATSGRGGRAAGAGGSTARR